MTLMPAFIPPRPFYNALTYEGSLYAIPFVAKPKVMGINVDLFKAAGIPIPSLTGA